MCDDYFETCCAIPSITKEISENYIPPGYVSDGKGNVVPNTTAQVNSPCSSTGNGQNPVISSPLKAQYKCGMRNEKGVGFSITGTIENESEYGEFPWMMAIINEQTATVNTFECGGSLIDRNVVLTGTFMIFFSVENSSIFVNYLLSCSLCPWNCQQEAESSSWRVGHANEK